MSWELQVAKSRSSVMMHHATLMMGIERCPEQMERWLTTKTSIREGNKLALQPVSQ